MLRIYPNKKIKRSDMKRIIFPAVLLVMLVMSVCVYTRDIRRDLKNSLIRLHVIAQSDSEYDQSVKLAVRDEVLASARGISARDTDAFEKAAETAALAYLEKNNVPYSARVCSGIFAFPEKQYENITLPAGEYFGIRVILGSGKGHNWWCVMYPPLCVDGNTSYAQEDTISELDTVLKPGTRELVLGSGKRVRFRILELLSH